VPKIFCGIRLEYFDRGASSRQDSLFSEHRFAVFLSRLSASPLPQKTLFFGVPFYSRCFAHWARFAGFALWEGCPPGCLLTAGAGALRGRPKKG